MRYGWSLLVDRKDYLVECESFECMFVHIVCNEHAMMVANPSLVLINGHLFVFVLFFFSSLNFPFVFTRSCIVIVEIFKWVFAWEKFAPQQRGRPTEWLLDINLKMSWKASLLYCNFNTYICINEASTDLVEDLHINSMKLLLGLRKYYQFLKMAAFQWLAIYVYWK